MVEVIGRGVAWERTEVIMRSARWLVVVLLGAAVAASFTGCSKFRKKPPTGDGTTGTNIGGVTDLAPGEGIDLGMGGARLEGEESRGMFPTVYFDYDSSQINAGERGKVEEVASYLRSNAGAAVVVEGHCDERGSNEYNLSLGDRRALAVRAYLIGLGVEADRVQTKSMGEENPVAMGHDESAWSKNRRGEFVLVR